MVSGLKSRRELSRKLRILRALTCSKSVKKSGIVADTILHIYKLKLQLAKIKRDDEPKAEVKVEKDGQGFVVRVKCEENVLVGVLEVFEKMGLMVLNASVSTKFKFQMEAFVAPQQKDMNSFGSLEGDVVAQAIVQAIKNHVTSSDG